VRFAYYPGCSARSTCAELNAATHRVAAKLGLELVQLDSATCTGARELRAIDPLGFHVLNVRILALSEREGLPLMTICNTCTLNVLDAHAAFVDDAELAGTVNERLADEGLRYSAASGHASAAPPSSVINSRRPILNMGPSPCARSATLAPYHNGARKSLGTGLNYPESG
jgi:heterodisulfide reductase subunit B